MSCYSFRVRSSSSVWAPIGASDSTALPTEHRGLPAEPPLLDEFKKDNNPYDATMLYLLSESHSSIHTFVDEGKLTLDLFTCDVLIDERNIKYIIGDYFGVSNSHVFSHQGVKKFIVICLASHGRHSSWPTWSHCPRPGTGR